MPAGPSETHLLERSNEMFCDNYMGGACISRLIALARGDAGTEKGFKGRREDDSEGRSVEDDKDF